VERSDSSQQSLTSLKLGKSSEGTRNMNNEMRRMHESDQLYFKLSIVGIALIPLAVSFLSPQNPIYVYMMLIGSSSLMVLTMYIVEALRQK
jgi:hypothetical protein